MPVHNADIAKIFSRVADLLSIEGGNRFRIRAYRAAARTIKNLPENITELLEEGRDLAELSGIGEDLDQKIQTIVETGKLPLLEKLEKKHPAGLVELLRLEQLGPKKVKKLYEELDIKSLTQLKAAAEKGEIRELEGFGKKTEENILEEIEHYTSTEQRVSIAEVEEVANSLMDYLKDSKYVKQALVAGSYRRRKETVGDLDILITAEKSAKVIDRFVKFEDVADVVSKGTTRSSVRLRNGLDVDLRVVEDSSYGSAAHYFTGSKAHNIAVRKIGVNKGLKINEYGVFKGKKKIAGKTEKEVYGTVGLPYIEPELRENRGEIEAARNNRLPSLVNLEDIKGDLHSHTTATDGRSSPEAMAEAARQREYDYLLVTDHTKNLPMTGGQDDKAVKKQGRKIDQLNSKWKDFHLLKGAEVDILEDGSLDLADDTLKTLDIVVVGVHSKFKLSEKQQTNRIIKALNNPHVDILAHPTGRILGRREGYKVNMGRILETAAELGVAVELNAQPARLDISDYYAKYAKELGVKIAISTDAHSTDELEYMKYGVYQARRGWLEKNDVLNTLTWSELRKSLRSRRS